MLHGFYLAHSHDLPAQNVRPGEESTLVKPMLAALCRHGLAVALEFMMDMRKESNSSLVGSIEALLGTHLFGRQWQMRLHGFSPLSKSMSKLLFL
jgi:hypothetical protein